MKLSRHWLSDFVDLSDLSGEELVRRFTEIGHAVDAVESHQGDTVFDLEITTNRVDAMSHLGMARELAAALGRELKSAEQGQWRGVSSAGTATASPVTIRIDAPEMCARYTGLVIRGVSVQPSPANVQRRLETVGLRPINNVVDATNYVMMALGHPLHAFDLDKLAGASIIVRPGREGEMMRSLDGETRRIDPQTVVIADDKRAVALGGIIGGAESEISATTRNVLLECAWFNPSVIRRTARRLGIKTDASYRFERRVDPNDTIAAIEAAAAMIGGAIEPVIDLVASQTAPKAIKLRTERLHEASGGAVGIGYALELFRRMGFAANTNTDGIDVTVPAYRGDIHEEMDLIEEVLRFYGLDRIPASLPRLSTGDMRPNVIGESEDEIRRILVGSGLTEVVNYSFIKPDHNSWFTAEEQVRLTNALTENTGALRLTMLPGLLENVAYNRSYGTRDGALFEVGRTYHRDGSKVVERHRVAVVMYGSTGSHWGDAKRAVDFFDVKGVVEQIAAKLHVEVTFAASGAEWLKPGRRAAARAGDRQVAMAGFLSNEILQKFGIKGEVAAAEIETEALLASTADWKMAPVAHFPGIPMILAITHSRDLQYQRLLDTIRELEVPYLHEVGLRDRFTPEDDESLVKTTLGMWYQAFDRSLTQEEVGEAHQRLASRVADLLPVKIL
ncbi:MAG TPA: phenylalanine--tRNA ligase subunit beta [Thermoanaerobaculia bacterium]|nr:phenylalanine--tRNA ligase subunit beta [Thermoanaerobaculia bacterium]